MNYLIYVLSLLLLYIIYIIYKHRVLIRNIFFVWRNWDVIKKSYSLIDNPNDKFNRGVLDNLTEDELGGVELLSYLYAFMVENPKINKKDFKHLRKVIRDK